jgi:hypothetical protein
MAAAGSPTAAKKHRYSITSSARLMRGSRTQLPGFQEKGKFVAAINSATFWVSNVHIVRACADHFHRFLNCFDCRVAAEHYMAL